jgi:hypothetical protein
MPAPVFLSKENDNVDGEIMQISGLLEDHKKNAQPPVNDRRKVRPD